ncbi:magnesium/cobalt transporter CorA [Candidatus Altiarchaeota archaeon]
MTKRSRRSGKSGLPPGSLVHVGGKSGDDVKISLIRYGPDSFQEKTVDDVASVFTSGEKAQVTWVNMDGLHDVNMIEEIGGHYKIHPLVLEDILNTNQRPKIDEFQDYLVVIMRMIYYPAGSKKVESEQVSLLIGKDYVVSFQEMEGDVFDSVRKRIRDGKGRIRGLGPDYLAYALIDAIVDNYFGIIEKFGDQIEAVEEAILFDPTPEALKSVYEIKREMIYLRRSIWPLREVVNSLERTDSPLINDSTNIFLRDVYDHTIQVIDTVEGYRDMVSGLLDTYMSSVSNKMNEVMKVLTIFATIFIPLTFIAGVYGMNFNYMPELQWRYGYFMAWAFMLTVGGIMLAYFRGKKWL